MPNPFQLNTRQNYYCDFAAQGFLEFGRRFNSTHGKTIIATSKPGFISGAHTRFNSTHGKPLLRTL